MLAVLIISTVFIARCVLKGDVCMERAQDKGGYFALFIAPVRSKSRPRWTRPTLAERSGEEVIGRHGPYLPDQNA